MRAANVADFYMTRYLSKAQEALGPVIQPFIAGIPEGPEGVLVKGVGGLNIVFCLFLCFVTNPMRTRTQDELVANFLVRK